MRHPGWVCPLDLCPPIPGPASLVEKEWWSRPFWRGLGPRKWVSSRQMVKKVKEDEMEVLWLVEVAGMARVVYLHHRVIGQVAELLQ